MKRSYVAAILAFALAPWAVLGMLWYDSPAFHDDCTPPAAEEPPADLDTEVGNTRLPPAVED